MSAFKAYTLSPHSSTGNAESTEGTPDTRLTAFSPDDVRLLKPCNPKTSGKTPNDGQNDPFITSLKAETKLSATASSFEPYSFRPTHSPSVARCTTPIPGTAQYLSKIIAESASSNTPQPQLTEPTHFGVFTTDTAASRYIKIVGIYGQEVAQKVKEVLQISHAAAISRSSIRFESIGKVVYLRFVSISDATSAYRAIKQKEVDFSVEYIPPNVYGQMFSPLSTHHSYSAHEGQVIITTTYPTSSDIDRPQFESNIRGLLTVEGPLCAWQKMSATEAGTFKMVAEFADASLAQRAAKRLDGQKIGKPNAVAISCSLHMPDKPGTSTARLSPIGTPTKSSGEKTNFAESFNRKTTIKEQIPKHTENIPQNQRQVPYVPGAAGFGIQASSVPVMMTGFYSPAPNGIHSTTADQIQVSGQQSDALRTLDQSGVIPLFTNCFVNDQLQRQQGFTSPHAYRYPHGQLVDPSWGGITPYSYPVNPGIGSLYDVSSPRRENPSRANNTTRGRRTGNSSNIHNNHVDIQKILLGLDVRTTVMLRNIPNKVDQAMLKEIIDESSFGHYTFMYLRIDFSNNCNVGYAFFDFISAAYIPGFYMARANKKWLRFKSEKVAEISYATIQGRDCLIQKFRNSSVMLEPQHYRPKLYFTIDGPLELVGQEEDFPVSDNASKLKRSCENAEHVGLFAPNASQHMRDEQRHRRSQFDRGTSLADREDFGFGMGQLSHYDKYSPPY